MHAVGATHRDLDSRRRLWRRSLGDRDLERRLLPLSPRDGDTLRPRRLSRRLPASGGVPLRPRLRSRVSSSPREPPRSLVVVLLSTPFAVIRGDPLPLPPPPPPPPLAAPRVGAVAAVAAAPPPPSPALTVPPLGGSGFAAATAAATRAVVFTAVAAVGVAEEGTVVEPVDAATTVGAATAGPSP